MEAGVLACPRMAPLDLGSRRRAPGELSTARNELVLPFCPPNFETATVTCFPQCQILNCYIGDGPRLPARQALHGPSRLTSNPALHNYW